MEEHFKLRPRPLWKRVLRLPVTLAKIMLITPRHPILAWRLAVLTLKTYR